MKPTEQIREQLLILRFQSGDDSALERLVERYQARLRYYVRRLLGGVAAEDDILQEVWVSVIRHLRSLREPKAFSAWVYRIARNKVYEQLGRKKRERTLDEEIEDVVDSDDTEEFSAAEAARVHVCLDKLDPRHREVLMLQFLEQMSYQDIAEVVGCTVGTVRSRIHYAKRALRRKLEEMHDDK